MIEPGRPVKGRETRRGLMEDPERGFVGRVEGEARRAALDHDTDAAAV